MEKAKILVVDDEEFVRRGLRRQIESAGHEVYEVRDGVDAMEIVKSNRLNLVISDIIMPNADGIELILEIRRLRGHDLPVVAISGGGRMRNLNLLKYAESLGANVVLSKPITSGQLLRTIEETMLPVERAV